MGLINETSYSGWYQSVDSFWLMFWLVFLFSKIYIAVVFKAGYGLMGALL